RMLIDGGPVHALSKYARREVTGISFLTRSMFKEGKASRCSRFFRVWSIKGMLGGVEGLSTSFRDAVLAPELVLLGTILRIGVSDHISATTTSKDHDSSHLMMGEVSLVY